MHRIIPTLFLGAITALFILSIAGLAGSHSDENFYCDPPSLSISGKVFAGYDELQPGVTIHLLHNGSLVGTTVSNKIGKYGFKGLDPGKYELNEVVPEGFTQIHPGCGSHRITLTDKSARHLDFMNRPSNLAATAGEDVRQPLPLMYLSKDELIAMEQAYEEMPVAIISPSIKAAIRESPGENFSLLNNLVYCPSERKQSCGNCWMWGYTPLLEVDLAVNKGIKDRLSIEYFADQFGRCEGGNIITFANEYRKLGKAVPWSNANAQWHRDNPPTWDSISTTPSYAISSIEYQRIPTTNKDGVVEREVAISNIKSILKQNKVVAFSFSLPTGADWYTFMHDFWSSHPESEIIKLDYACGKNWNGSKGEGAGHGVACVGYDDSDPNNRYWIMLNSWGITPGRPNGLFRVSMDMDYDCRYLFIKGDKDVEDIYIYAFYWNILNITYPNYPPAIPDWPSGPSEGQPGIEYSYSASAIDPEGDMVSYLFDWGDGTESSTGPVSSGTMVGKSHTWQSPGNYCVRVSAVDDQGASSVQSGPLRISVGRQSPDPSIRKRSINRDNIRIGDLTTTSYGSGQAINKIDFITDQRT
jgi:hypothetical protein